MRCRIILIVIVITFSPWITHNGLSVDFYNETDFNKNSEALDILKVPAKNQISVYIPIC